MTGIQSPSNQEKLFASVTRRTRKPFELPTVLFFVPSPKRKRKCLIFKCASRKKRETQMKAKRLRQRFCFSPAEFIKRVGRRLGLVFIFLLILQRDESYFDSFFSSCTPIGSFFFFFLQCFPRSLLRSFGSFIRETDRETNNSTAVEGGCMSEAANAKASVVRARLLE